MMVTANDNQNNATAFGRIDTPQHTVVARNARIPYRWKRIISQALKSANIDICALSEVRREWTGNIVEKDFTIYWSSGTRIEAAVGFSNNLLNVSLDLTPLSDSVMCLRLQLSSREYLNLISVYSPIHATSSRRERTFIQPINRCCWL